MTDEKHPKIDFLIEDENVVSLIVCILYPRNVFYNNLKQIEVLMTLCYDMHLDYRLMVLEVCERRLKLDNFRQF